LEIIISEVNGYRFLQLGPNLVQGMMKIDAPYLIGLEYVREMMAPLLLNSNPAWPRNALFIGLGAGSMQKFLHQYRPDCAISTVEISGEVLEAAQTHFQLPTLTNKFQVHVQCGAEFMEQCTTQFDLIVIDAYCDNLETNALQSDSFYLNCKSCLSPQGYVVNNLLRIQAEFDAILNRFSKAFDSVSWPMFSGANINAIVMSHTGAGFKITKAELEENCRQLKTDTGLDMTATVKKLTESLVVS